MRSRIFCKKTLVGLLFLPLALCLVAGSALAETAKNATILNVVNVEYMDANGNGQDGTATGPAFVKSASATVTVDLLAAVPTVTGPTPASDQTVASGATQIYEFTMYSNANGDDLYDFAIDGTATPDKDVAGKSKTISSVTLPDGSTATPGTVDYNNFTIGATIILSNTAIDTISIPYGSENGIGNGDDVIINGTQYTVNTVTAGSAPTYLGDILTDETNATISLYDHGTTNPAAIGGIDTLTGEVISELYLFQVSVTATAINDLPGELYFTVVADANAGGVPITSISNVKTTFTASVLNIEKLVRNPLIGSTWGATATGKPGDLLEYQVTVTSAGGNATKVVVTDAVPAYTTLVVNAGNFAVVDDETDVVPITTLNTDTEDDQVASGNAVGTAAGDAITFYIGTDNDGDSNAGTETGGTVAAGTTYVIKYGVTIN